MAEGFLNIIGITAPETATLGEIVNFTVHTQNIGIEDNFKVELSGDLTGSQEFSLGTGLTNDIPFSFIMPNHNSNIIVSTYHFEDENLISYWKFNEGSGVIVHDSVGNNHGTITGITISFESAGMDDGNYSHIYINGEDKSLGGRGINVVRLSWDGSYIESKHFDTYLSEENSNNLATYLNSIDEWDIVILAVRDEASTNLNANVKTAITNLGSTEINNLGYRDSWGMISTVGEWRPRESYVPQYNGIASGIHGGWVGGKVGNAFNSNGLGGNLGVNCGSLSDSNYPISDQLTVAFWINPGERYQTTISGGGIFGIGDISESYGEGNFKIYDTLGNYAEFFAVGEDTAKTGEWSHYAMTYDGNDLKVYKNGVYLTEWYDKTITGELANSNSDLIILPSDYEGGDNSIDEVKIYNRALSAGEIQALYLG